MPQQILILGGGFAGLVSARRLERLLRPGEAEVTLVSRDNFMLFTPMLPEVSTGGIETRHVVAPLRAELRRARFMLGEVIAIDLSARQVEVQHPIWGTTQQLRYDQLVIALGGDTSTFGLPGVDDYSLPLKTLDDAGVLRNRVIATLEMADVNQDRAARKRLLTYVVVGGGFTGVEAAGELVDFLNSIRRFYRTIKPDEVSIVLIEGGATLLPGLPSRMGRYSLRNLSGRGVDVVVNEPVASADAAGLMLKSGRRIDCATIIWSAGVRPPRLIQELPVQHARNGAIVVRADLSVPDQAGVWALGDCASIPAGEGKTYPPTAQHAIREATVAASNVAAAIRGRPSRPFRYASLGMMASLGGRRGVAVIGRNFVLTGFPAWFVWRTYYLWRLPGLDRKIRVAFDWTISLVFPRDIAVLRVFTERGQISAYPDAGTAPERRPLDRASS